MTSIKYPQNPADAQTQAFSKCMAMDQIRDALANLETPHGRGIAVGLCSAFYMCGLINVAEWEMFMSCIPAETQEMDTNKAHSYDPDEIPARNTVLN